MMQTGQHIEQAIKDYITESFMYDRPRVIFDNDLELIQEGIIDSLGVFMLISFLEERFAIAIQPEDVLLEHFETVDGIRDLVEAKLSSRP